jgi:hypothetical protein
LKVKGLPGFVFMGKLLRDLSKILWASSE